MFLPKNRCDQVILDPIQNRVAARSALYEAALFEALLYEFPKPDQNNTGLSTYLHTWNWKAHTILPAVLVLLV